MFERRNEASHLTVRGVDGDMLYKKVEKKKEKKLSTCFLFLYFFTALLFPTTILAQLSNNPFSRTHTQAYVRMHTYTQTHARVLTEHG